MKLHRFILGCGAALSFILLAACATPSNTHQGIPDDVWQQMHGDAKQMVIDKSYQDSMTAPQPSAGKNTDAYPNDHQI